MVYLIPPNQVGICFFLSILLTSSSAQQSTYVHIFARRVFYLNENYVEILHMLPSQIMIHP